MRARSRFAHRRGGLCVAAGILLAALPASAESASIIDDFDYPDTAAARASWTAIDGSPAVEMADSGSWGSERVLRFPCNLGVQPWRCAWDHPVSLDLSAYATFALDIFVADSAPISVFTLHFRSGNGWYGKNAEITRSGWQTLYFDRIGFWTEGTPTGWNQIQQIRFSPWKEFGRDTFLTAGRLRALTPDLLILRDAQSLDPGTVERTTASITDWLGSWGVRPAAVNGAFVDAGGLAPAKLLILPYNETVPPTQMTRIEAFVAGGGKLMVHYLLNDRLEDLLGVDLLAWTPGNFAAFTLSDPAIPHLPPRVEQISGSIMTAAPRAQLNAHTIGEWKDSFDASTGKPSWIASDNGLYMSYVLLDGDEETKRRMLLSLVGHHVPGVWPIASATAYDAVGRIGEYATYDEAVADIGARAAGTPRAAQVGLELAAAEAARSLAGAERASGDHDDAVYSALDARGHLLEAHARCQSPALPEMRGVWEIDPEGPAPGGWSVGIEPLVTHGFSAIFPLMLTGGVAHYASTVLPHSAEFGEHGDLLAACVAAAHARGIEVHVWKINYNLLYAPQSFINSMRAQVRTQVSSTGAPIDWLCPSHPANIALERDSMLELVELYDVDGIHFDHIRYPGPDSCYCDGCRVRFPADTGIVVTHWPADVLAGGPFHAAFLDWRREQITKLVREVFAATKALKPSVVVSAAVWSDYAWSFDGIGQDSSGWVDEGILDAICPMNYTAEHGLFRQRVTEQVASAAGRVPVWPGIGALSATSTVDPDGVIAQVAAAREIGASGVLLFEYAPGVIDETLPALATGVTLPVGAAETPDGGAVLGDPLRIGIAGGGEIDLSWGDACGSVPATMDYAVYQGSLVALRAGSYDHVPVACSTAGVTSTRIAAPAEDAYFLVVANDSSREGRYGFTSAGSPRPPSSVPCLPSHPAACP